MADELKISVAMEFAKGLRAIDSSLMDVLAKEFDVAGTNFDFGTQTIGLTPEAIALGDVATAGYCLFVNISTYNGSNYVTLRNGSSGADLPQLFGGDIALFRLTAGAVLYADATGATQELLKMIVEL